MPVFPTKIESAAGPAAVVMIGERAVPSNEARGRSSDDVTALKANFEARLTTGLTEAGYPTAADPARMNPLGCLRCVADFRDRCDRASTGPIAACLVELFPTRIRYTALSLPYHIGTGWIGGFVPFTAFAIVTAVGNIYSGLWYPFAFTAISVLFCLLFLPETRSRSLDA